MSGGESMFMWREFRSHSITINISSALRIFEIASGSIHFLRWMPRKWVCEFSPRPQMKSLMVGTPLEVLFLDFLCGIQFCMKICNPEHWLLTFQKETDVQPYLLDTSSITQNYAVPWQPQIYLNYQNQIRGQLQFLSHSTHIPHTSLANMCGQKQTGNIFIIAEDSVRQH